MKDFIAVVRVEDGKVAKYLDFDTKAEAEAHVGEYGGFVTPNPGGIRPKLWDADDARKILINDPVKVKDYLDQRALIFIRAKRDRLLRESDFSQLPNSTMNKEAWETYRQKLRDLPADIPNPADFDNDADFPAAP